MAEPEPLEQLLAQVDVPALRAERERHVGAIAEHEQRVSAIDQLLALKGAGAGDPTNWAAKRSLTLAEVEELTRPSLAASILEVMATAEEWNADLILGHLRLKNRMPKGKTPKNSVAATLSRLHKDRKVQRTRPGFYTLARHGQGATPAATGEAQQQQQRLVEEEG